MHSAQMVAASTRTSTGCVRQSMSIRAISEFELIVGGELRQRVREETCV